MRTMTHSEVEKALDKLSSHITEDGTNNKYCNEYTAQWASNPFGNDCYILNCRHDPAPEKQIVLISPFDENTSSHMGFASTEAYGSSSRSFLVMRFAFDSKLSGFAFYSTDGKKYLFCIIVDLENEAIAEVSDLQNCFLEENHLLSNHVFYFEKTVLVPCTQL